MDRTDAIDDPATAAPDAARVAERRRAFRRLHESGCFVLPNPWDLGSARLLAQLGFQALASTSSGFAWSQGRRDGAVSRDRLLDHLRELVAATGLPVNADFENGFGDDARAVGDSVALAIETGIAGLSIEDATGDPARPLFELPEAVDRIRAARAAVDRAGGDVILVGRAEGFLHGRPDLDDAIRRLQAYADAGADCLYAPGLADGDQMAAVVAAVAPKPVNVLVGGTSRLDVAAIAALGVRRISVGGALARAAWGGFMRAATRLREGSFDGFAEAAAGSELNRRLGG